MGCTFDGILEDGFSNWVWFEFPDTVPALDNRGYNVHIPEWEIQLIKDYEKGDPVSQTGG
jgi:hypothetical protein